MKPRALPTAAQNPWHRSALSNEALLELLQNCTELSEDDAAFAESAATDLELSKRLSKAVRDRLMAIAKHHELIKPAPRCYPARYPPEVPGQKTFVLGPTNADIAGAAAYDKLVAGAAAALANKPPIRRAG